MKAQQLFSQMAERTEATDWSIEMVEANAITMRIEWGTPLISADDENNILQDYDKLNRIPDKKKKWCSIARFMGSKLIMLGMSFDSMVKQTISKAHDDDCRGEFLSDDIEREALAGLKEAPEYELFKSDLKTY